MGGMMRTLAICGAIALGFGASSPAFAQNAAFEFRGETTEQVIDMSAKRCGSAAEDGSITCTDISGQLAGVSGVSTAVSYYEGRMFMVIGIFDTGEYLTILRAFTQKYGAPTVSSEDWQNRAGATFSNDVATWRFSGGTLQLRRLGGRINQGSFEFIHAENSPPLAPPTVDF